MESKTETVSDNELIAKFMGSPLSEKLMYHRSFDCLMPVVEKIYNLEDGVKRLGFVVTLKNSRCTIVLGKKKFSCHTISPLNSTYRVVVEFIRWYSSQSTEAPKNSRTAFDYLGSVD